VIALAVIVGFFWTIQVMVFKGKWSYFIFFLALFLPIYITTLSLTYQATQSAELVMLFQLLKDVVVILAVIFFILYQRKMAQYEFKLKLVDILFLLFLTLAFLFLFLPVGESNFVSKGIYFKNMLMPALVYFLARNTDFKDLEVKRLFQIIFLVAILALGFNVLEGVLNTHLQSYTGYALFNHGIYDIEPTGNFGLSWTFETQLVTKRFASFFSDPLELASSVMMGFSAGLIWFLTSKKEVSLLYILVMLCSIGSLFYSSSRAALAAFFIMLFFLALVFRLYKLLFVGFVAFMGLVIFAVFFATDELYYYVLDTLTFENASSVGHVVEWLIAIDSMIAKPLGIGLAMSGNLGSVTDEVRVGGENQFLIYGVQLGVLGMLLYILLLIFAIFKSLKVFRTTNNLMTARIAFTAAAVKVGLLLPLFTANADLYAYVSWISWWMVGYAMNHYEQKDESYVEA
jgi:hypothetical protein